MSATEIILKDGIEYYRADVKDLIVDEKPLGNIQEYTYPIRKIEQLSSTSVRVTYEVSRFNFKLNYKIITSRDCNRTRIEEETFKQVVKLLNELGGLKYQSKRTLQIQVYLYCGRDGKYRIDDTHKIRIINSETSTNIIMPNIYQNGNICWGNTSFRTADTTLNCGSIVFDKFINSDFNSEISRGYDINNHNKESYRQYLEKSREIIKNKYEEKEQKVFLKLIDEMKNKTSVNILLILILNTITEQDNLEVEKNMLMGK